MDLLKIIVAIGLLSSCVAPRPTLIEYSNLDTIETTVEIVPRDTVIIIERTQAAANFDMDSLVREMRKGRTVYVNSGGQASLRMSMDSLGRVFAEARCDELEKTIQTLNQIIRIEEKRTRTIVDTHNGSDGNSAYHTLLQGSLIIFVLGMIAFLVYIIARQQRKTPSN